MTKPISKSIYKIAEKVDSMKIVIFTEHLKIDGELFTKNSRCEECHEDILPIQNALVCRLNDYCVCEGEDCKCDDYVCFHYDWLNISINDIVAYSIV